MKNDIKGKFLYEFQDKLLRFIIGICLCEILWKLIQGKHARLKGKFLSPVIIAVPKIREIPSNSNNSHDHFFPTYKSNQTHSLYYARTFVPFCLTQTNLKMIQKTIDVKSAETNPVTKSYEVKMLGVKMGEKGTSKESMVYDFSEYDDEFIMFLDPKSWKMIVSVDTSTDKSNGTDIKKRKASEKVSVPEKGPHMHVHNIIESMFVNEEDLSIPIGKDIHHVKTMSEGQNMEPHVESYIDQHVEPNVGASDLTSDKPQDEPPYAPIGD